MKIFNIGELNWKDTQLIYHTLAYMNIESLIFHSSKQRYVCVGLHQDPRNEIDIDYCKNNNIGIFRRETGGGTVLLDKNQIFFNIIINRSNPKTHPVPQKFFKKFLQPVIQSLQEFGIKADFHPICDLIVNGKKISGNGGGEIGQCNVLVGNILLDFDYKLMSKVINSPLKIKERYYDLMKENMTTIHDELGFIPLKEEFHKVLIKKYEDLFGELELGKLNDEIIKKMKELEEKYSDDQWMYQRGVKKIGSEIKIREGVFLYYKNIKTLKGIYQIVCETEENIIKETYFSGEKLLSYYNTEKIREKLTGLCYDKVKLDSIIDDVINKYGGVLVA